MSKSAKQWVSISGDYPELDWAEPDSPTEVECIYCGHYGQIEHNCPKCGAPLPKKE